MAIEKPEPPREYVNYMIMREMGWSYQELMATPYDVVCGIMSILNTLTSYRKRGKHGD